MKESLEKIRLDAAREMLKHAANSLPETKIENPDDLKKVIDSIEDALYLLRRSTISEMESLTKEINNFYKRGPGLEECDKYVS